MHSIVRWYIRTSVVFLLVGVVLGIWMAVQKELLDSYPNPQLVTAHTHVILVGFVMGMILGVAQWMFPRPPREGSWYSPDLAQIVYGIFTLSTVVRTLGEIVGAGSESALWHWFVVLGGVGQGLAFVLFFYNIWPRIRPVGSHIREAKGEKF